MQNFIVNLKEDASDADVADAKKSVESQGGTIKDVRHLSQMPIFAVLNAPRPSH